VIIVEYGGQLTQCYPLNSREYCFGLLWGMSTWMWGSLLVWIVRKYKKLTQKLPILVEEEIEGEGAGGLHAPLMRQYTKNL
jgi:hypothetical protein